MLSPRVVAPTTGEFEVAIAASEDFSEHVVWFSVASCTERLGSGDGERKTLLTRQIAFEPLPTSVLFALVGAVGRAHESVVCPPEPPGAKEVCVVIWSSSALRRPLAR